MNIENMEEQQLIETRDVINKELKYAEALNNPKLIDFRLAFVIAKDSIESELLKRQQYQLI